MKFLKCLIFLCLMISFNAIANENKLTFENENLNLSILTNSEIYIRCPWYQGVPMNESNKSTNRP